MQIRELLITHPLGLHARACARIVQLASRFRCNVSISIGNRHASARNIVPVMLLAVSMGATVRIETEGPDEGAAMTAMVQLIDRGLAERRPG